MGEITAATDDQIARLEAYLPAIRTVPVPDVLILIARIRQEQARADHTKQLLDIACAGLREVGDEAFEAALNEAEQRAEAAEAEAARLREAINANAWSPGGQCYHCENFNSWGEGHKPDCALLGGTRSAFNGT